MSPHVLRLSARAAIVSLALSALACAAGVKPSNPTGAGSGGSSSSGNGGTTSAGSGGRGGSSPSGVGGSSSSGTGGSSACQTGAFEFKPMIPTVYLAVDRSGSMFDCISTANVEPTCATIADTTWGKLKDGILPVVMNLQHDIRFGFATIMGTNKRFGGTCPILDKVAPALENYTAISALYSSLPPAPNSTQSGMKFETPTAQVLQMIGAELMADTTPGAKYVLFVTDGEPDYCGDGNALCPPDSVVWRLQQLYTAGIKTLVFGLKATIAQDLPAGVLEAFASAGAGEPTKAPLRGTSVNKEDFYDQCYNTGAPPDDAAGGWTADFVAAGKTPGVRGQTLGVYAAAGGPTKPYTPDVNNQQALTQQLTQVISGVKSCTFDLSNVDPTKPPIRVDPTQLNKASILIEGQAVPLDDANGWRLMGTSQVELVGTACTNWRLPTNTHITFNFPCEIIVPT